MRTTGLGKGCGAWRLAAAAAVVAALARAAPAQAVQSATTAVTMGGVPCICFAGLYAAWSTGPFEQQGLALRQYVSTGGGSFAFQALLAGDVDIYVSALVEVARGRAEGRPVRVVGTLYPEIWALVVRSDLRGRVDRVEDLRGLKVGVTSIGSGTWAFANAVARAYGLDPQRDLSIVPLGGLASIIAGLKAGRVEAAIVWPGASQAVLAEAGFPLVDLLKADDHRRALGASVSLSQVVAVREELIQRRPDLIRRVVAALGEAYRWVKQQPVERVAEVVAPYVGSADPTALRQTVAESLPAHPETPALRRQAYQVSHDLLHNAGLLREPVPFDSLVDCRFAGCEP